MWIDPRETFRLLLALVALAPGLAAADGEFGIRLSYLEAEKAQGAAFAVPDAYRPFPVKQAQQDAYLRLRNSYGKFNGRVTEMEDTDCCAASAKGFVNELYASVPLGPSVEASIGKKVASWGIGQGFRPLDVIQREDRQAVEPLDLEGVPMVLLESFTDTSALAVVAANRSLADGMERATGEMEYGLKFSALLGNTDVQSVAYVWEGRELALGAGAANTFGIHFETHGSINYLAYYMKRQHILAGQRGLLQASSDPYMDTRGESGVQALVGGSWTWESGFSLMMEAWHDDSAYTKQEWRDLLELTRSQRDLLAYPIPPEAVYGNINANSRFYRHPNLLQDTVMARLFYEGEDFDPEAYLLWTPADGGVQVTVAANYRLRDGIIAFGSARMAARTDSAAYGEAANWAFFFVGIRIEGALR